MNSNLLIHQYCERIERSISFLGQDHDFFTDLKAHHLIRLVRTHLGNPDKAIALDVGCGVGLTDRFLAHQLGKLYGVDIKSELIKAASDLNPSVQYKIYDGRRLPFSDESFDLVFAISVLHSLIASNLNDFVLEMKRVTRKGGLFIIFEHNPKNPLSRLAAKRFDPNIVLINISHVHNLFKENDPISISKGYFGFFPWGRRFSRAIDRCLHWLPLGAQYYVACKK